MTKKILSFFLAILIMVSSSITVFSVNSKTTAEVQSEYDLDKYYRSIQVVLDALNGPDWDEILGETYLIYPQVVDKAGYGALIKAGMYLTDQELTELSCISILTNLLAIINTTEEELFAHQAQYDTVKTVGDYLWDLGNVGVDMLSVYSKCDQIGKTVEEVANDVGLVWDGTDSLRKILNTAQDLENAQQLVAAYKNNCEFLQSIIDHTKMDELHSAAQFLLKVEKIVFTSTFKNITKGTEETGKYFVKHVVFDELILKEIAEHPTDYGLSDDELLGIAILQKAEDALSAITLAKDYDVLVFDMLMGISDIANRYNEMFVLTAVRRALADTIVPLRRTINSPTSTDEIIRLQTLTHALLCVNYRGEYCVHEMMLHNAQVYSLILQVTGNDNIYETQLENIKGITSGYFTILDLLTPDLSKFKRETEEDSLYTLFRASTSPENELLYVCEDYDGDGNKEAFGITGNGSNVYEYCDSVRIYYISTDGRLICVADNLSGYVPSGQEPTLRAGTHRYLIWEKSGNGSGSCSFLLGVKDGNCFSPSVSDQYEQFQKKNGTEDHYVGYVSRFDNGHQWDATEFIYNEQMHEFVHLASESDISTTHESTLDKEAPLVTDAYRLDTEDTKSPYTDELISFAIPHMNLPGEHIESVNSYLYDTLYPHTASGLKWNSENDGLSKSWMEYSWYVNGDILSLIVTDKHQTSKDTYIYNISIANGNEVDKQELYGYAGFTEAVGQDRVRDALGSAFCDDAERQYGAQPGTANWQDDAFAVEQLEFTISDTNVEAAKLYLKDNGKLWASAKIGSLAGPAYPIMDVNVSDFEMNQSYAEYMREENNTSEITPNSTMKNLFQVTDAYCHTRPGQNIYYNFPYEGNPMVPHCYHIPKIQIDGINTDELNQEIYQKWYSYLEEWGCFQDEPSSITFLNYTVGRKGSSASILYISSLSWGPELRYEIMNLSAASGERISSAELLREYGMDTEQIKQLVSDYILANYSTYPQECLDESLSEANLNRITPYVNENSELCAVFPIYVMAGALDIALNLQTGIPEVFSPCNYHSDPTSGESQPDVPEESKPELSSPPLAEITPDENDPDAARFLAMIMEQTARDSVKYLCCYDYDGDGQKEAFAVVANSVQSSPDGEKAEVWFASDYEVTCLLDNIYNCVYIKSVSIGSRVLFTASSTRGLPFWVGFTYTVSSGHPDKVGNSANLLIMDYNGDSLLFSEGSDTDGEHGVGRYVYYYHETWDEQQYALVKESGVYYKASTGELVYFQSPTHLKMALRENRV